MVLVCHKVVPPLLYDWISLLLFAPLRSLLDCHENYRFKFAFNALMHSHVVLKKQIVLLVESVDKLLHSAKKKGMHLIHFEKSASENDIIRLYLFRLQTISGNPFTPFRVFGCTWKIEFFIYFDHKIRPLTRKMNAAFVLPSNHFQAHRRAKREREWARSRPNPGHIGEIAPIKSSHRDRTPALVSPSRSSPPKTNLVLDPKLINATDLVISISSPMTDLVVSILLPMTDLIVSISSPMTHDWSLCFPQFSITFSSSLSQFDQIF